MELRLLTLLTQRLTVGKAMEMAMAMGGCP